MVGTYVQSVYGNWISYHNPTAIPATPGSIGGALGIRFVNTGTGFANLDNVTLSVDTTGD